MLRKILNFIIGLFRSTQKAGEISYLPPKYDLGEKRPPWLITAEKELGQKEIYGTKDNLRIVEYGESVDLEINDDETPWCSTFVNFVLIKSGYRATRSAAARSFLNWGIGMDEPKLGAILVFKRGNSDWQGHVGFYVGETKNYYKVLGGNQGNSVSIAKYAKKDLLGIRWPNS